MSRSPEEDEVEEVLEVDDELLDDEGIVEADEERVVEEEADDVEVGEPELRTR